MREPVSEEAIRALIEVGQRLRDAGYAFTTITPESHRRVNARPAGVIARDLRDVFGWSRPFEPQLVPAPLLVALERANAVEQRGHLRASRVRFSTLGGGLYLHSAYPTVDERAVFFGPDTYRFCAYLAREAPRCRRVVDVGCGSGAGGLSIAARAERVVLADINPGALAFARVNAALAGVTERTETVLGDLFGSVAGEVDLIVANPPYLLDPGKRVYRDGGGELGIDLGVRIVREGLARLAPGGTLLLYTGAPVVDGVDRVRQAITQLADARGARCTYEELDPDVFGEELDTPDYAAVERIAAIGARITLA